MATKSQVRKWNNEFRQLMKEKKEHHRKETQKVYIRMYRNIPKFTIYNPILEKQVNIRPLKVHKIYKVQRWLARQLAKWNHAVVLGTRIKHRS